MSTFIDFAQDSRYAFMTVVLRTYPELLLIVIVKPQDEELSSGKLAKVIKYLKT